MAKVLAYWHVHALGFSNFAYSDARRESSGVTSIVLTSGNIKLVFTSAYPTYNSKSDVEVSSFINQYHCGVKRIALSVSNVTEVFETALSHGAFPVKFPVKINDEFGYIEEAAIRLYDSNEIMFINRENYTGVFKPGYRLSEVGQRGEKMLTDIDHIASELRINESQYWSEYLTKTLGTETVQKFERNEENKTGMILKVNQSMDQKLTLVIAEPASYLQKSKVQQNLDQFGQGIHHLAFHTDNIINTIKQMTENAVEFVSFPGSYYDLLRNNADFKEIDINTLQECGILIDKEGDTYLLQKFIKPISDRPFFFYEIVQRVNGYNGFALKNINVLKKAEEIEIMNLSKNVN